MQEPELVGLSSDEPFQFKCHPDVPCFNQCCRDLNQALTPFDVLKLRTHLGLSWEQFLKRHAALYEGPSTGLPVVSLRFSAADDQRCPFVTDAGCSVYDARPTSCRLYPLARALQRNRSDGSLSEHFALVKESHCLGFKEGPTQIARDWVENQDAQDGLDANDAMMELISLKNRLRPGTLPPEQQQWVVMAFYDLDRLKGQAEAIKLPSPTTEPMPTDGDDYAWLAWGLKWVRKALFGDMQ